MQFRVIVVIDPQTHKQTQPQTHRQDQLQYTAPQLARCVTTHNRRIYDHAVACTTQSMHT